MNSYGGWTLHLVKSAGSKVGFLYRFWSELSKKEFRLSKEKTDLILDLERKEQHHRILADKYQAKIDSICKEALKKLLN